MTRSDEAAAIEARLRAALDVELTAIREGVDMSPTAITSRLRELAEVSTLCFELAVPPRSR